MAFGTGTGNKRARTFALRATVAFLFVSTTLLLYPGIVASSGRTDTPHSIGQAAGTTLGTLLSNASSAFSSAGLNFSETAWNPITDFYSFLNYGVFNDGGDCYGFASTAILYFEHYQLSDQSKPYYPEPNTPSVASLSGETGTPCFLNLCLNSTDGLDQATFPIYIHQTYDPNNNVIVPSTETSYLETMEQSIRSGTPVILGLGPSDLHSVVAWGYAQYANGTTSISISDPNSGNVPRYAIYHDGSFSYTDYSDNKLVTYTTFNVISPGLLQWSWLALKGLNGAQLRSTVTSTNPYYTYIFSSVPIAISGAGGQASFEATGGASSFVTTIPGAVAFEENGIQVYGIPQPDRYSISDSGETSSSVTVVIPQNQTSVVGYGITITSPTSPSLTISPWVGGLNLTASNDVSSSLTFFSLGQAGYSALNATGLSLKASQTADFAVPNWAALNNTLFAPTLSLIQGNKVIESNTITNGQQETSTSTNQSAYLPTGLLSMAIAGTIAVLTLFAGVKLRQAERKGRQNPT